MKQFKLIAIILTTVSVNVCAQNYNLIVDGGFGYRLIEPDTSYTPSYASYVNKKKSGLNINIEAVWYSEGNGFGLKYSSFMNSISENDVEKRPYFYICKSEKIKINYYSLQYHNRMQIKKPRLFGEISIGLGIVRYYSDGKEMLEPISIVGKTYGMNAALALDYVLFKHLSAGISTNLFLATLSDDTINGNIETLKPKHSLSRFDINGGFRIKF